MADQNLQDLVDMWGNQQLATTQSSVLIPQEVQLPTEDWVSRSSTKEPGVMDFLKNNPMTANTFQDVTNSQYSPSDNVALWQKSGNPLQKTGTGYLDRLKDIVNQPAPSYLSSILNNYEKQGESALQKMTGPSLVNMKDYSTPAAMSGQLNAEGGENISKVATDYQASQQANYQTFQATQSQIDQALQTLSSEDTAQSATMAFNLNAINQVLAQGPSYLVDTSQLAEQIQENFNSFTNYSNQMQEIFTSYLKLSYNLPNDITSAMWQNNAAPGIMEQQIEDTTKDQAVTPAVPDDSAGG